MDSNTEPPQVDANDLTNKLHSQLLLKHTGLHKIIIYKKNYNSRVRFYKKNRIKLQKTVPYLRIRNYIQNYYLKDSRLPRPLNGAATSSRHR